MTILALDYKDALDGGLVFCSEDDYWASLADFMYLLARPHDINYDIKYICMDGETKFDLEYERLYSSFFTLYYNKNEPREEAFNYLANSKWAMSLEEGLY